MGRYLLLQAVAVAVLSVGCSARIAGTPIGPTNERVTTTIATAAPSATTPSGTVNSADRVLATSCEAFNGMSEQEQQRVSHQIAVALGRSDLANNVNFDLVARAGCLMHPTQLVKDTWAFD